MMDGVDVTDQHQGGTLIQISIDALQEFNFQQNGYSAEFPRAGGIYNSTTTSGTNQVHGTLFEFLRNNDLDARDFFGAERGVLKRNQFGGVVGEHLSVPKIYNGKNRTFLMPNYEGYRRVAGVPFTDVVLSTAMLQGDFSAPGLSRIVEPDLRSAVDHHRVRRSRNTDPVSGECHSCGRACRPGRGYRQVPAAAEHRIK